jgi:hypothetical protein
MKRILLASVVAGAACMFPAMSFAGAASGEPYPYWTAGKLNLAYETYGRASERRVHARARIAPSCLCEPPGQVGTDPRGQWEDYPGWRWNGDPRWQWDGYPRWLWHG